MHPRPRACDPRASGVYIRQATLAHVITYTYITLHGQIKGKSRDTLKYYPENWDTFEMYPGKVIHMIGG